MLQQAATSKHARSWDPLLVAYESSQLLLSSSSCDGETLYCGNGLLLQAHVVCASYGQLMGCASTSTVSIIHSACTDLPSLTPDGVGGFLCH